MSEIKTMTSNGPPRVNRRVRYRSAMLIHSDTQRSHGKMGFFKGNKDNGVEDEDDDDDFIPYLKPDTYLLSIADITSTN